MRIIRILIVSNAPINEENNTGNTILNIFNGMEKVEIYNIYCRDGYTSERVVRSFKITEQSLIKNIFSATSVVGEEIDENINLQYKSRYKRVNYFNYARKHRFQIFFFIREIIWKFGKWDSLELEKFINDVNPDIIFQPIYYSLYINNLAKYVIKKSKKKAIGYVMDDVYTMKQSSFSPLYWFDRLIKRRNIRNLISNIDYLYTISEVQKQEYSKIFNIPMEVLRKGIKYENKIKFSFLNLRPKFKNEKVNLIYAGNIGDNRWKTLKILAEKIYLTNKEKNIVLEIYTGTPIKQKLKNEFKKYGVNIKSPLKYEEILKLQEKADFVLHIEALSQRESLKTRLSFSTKIVDFLKLETCIVAIGNEINASIKYLKDYEAAIVLTNLQEIESFVERVLEYRDNKYIYENKSREVGIQNHDIEKIQKDLFNNIQKYL